MTAIETPANDAPAQEWGALAKRIPGWRWPISTDSAPEPDMPGLFRIGRLPWRSTPYAQSKHQWSQHYGKGECVPDPDHWAWEGWLWRLAGMPEVMVERGGERVRIWDGRPEYMMTQAGATGITKGRALISYAAALGRWPGGDS